MSERFYKWLDSRLDSIIRKDGHLKGVTKTLLREMDLYGLGKNYSISTKKVLITAARKRAIYRFERYNKNVQEWSIELGMREVIIEKMIKEKLIKNKHDVNRLKKILVILLSTGQYFGAYNFKEYNTPDD